MLINISDANVSYFLGLLITDGSIYINRKNPNKGKITIELKYDDKFTLENMINLFPFPSSLYTRIRSTNFSKNYKTITWNCSQKEMRDWLMSINIPCGKKSQTIKYVQGAFKKHFWRGVIDGDGSLGFTKDGLPFISLVTASEQLRNDYLEYIHSVTGKKFNPQRNVRDGVYNILILKENAVLLAENLYPVGEYNFIPRKKQMANKIQEWKRPDTMRSSLNIQKWDESQDKIVLENTCSTAMELLNRSKASILCRKRRLKAFKSSNQSDVVVYTNE